jgi:hypothetical protein
MNPDAFDGSAGSTIKYCPCCSDFSLATPSRGGEGCVSVETSMTTIDPAVAALMPGLPFGVDLDSPEGRALHVEIINARLGGLARVSFVDGMAGATVVSLEAQRAKREAMRERPL